jgi:hypothetical protein
MKITQNEIRVAVAAISWMERDEIMSKLAEVDSSAALDMQRLRSVKSKLEKAAAIKGDLVICSQDAVERMKRSIGETTG